MQINHNGSLRNDSHTLSLNQNRGLAFGDSLFDTLRIEAGKIQYGEEHYFRLMSSMRMLRMKIPADFTLEGYEMEIEKTAEANGLSERARARVTVYRGYGGGYSPLSNQSEFLIEVNEMEEASHKEYEIELFKDFHVCSGLLSTIKTNNRMVNVLGGVFARENDYQNSVLINERKELVGATDSNVFLVKDGKIRTPALESGCINGIIRKKVIEAASSAGGLEVNQEAISPFELLKADEVFLTNSIFGVQPVGRYRKKRFSDSITRQVIELLKERD